MILKGWFVKNYSSLRNLSTRNIFLCCLYQKHPDPIYTFVSNFSLLYLIKIEVECEAVAK